MSPNQIEGSQTPRAALWHGATSHTPLVNVCEPVVRGEGVAALQTDSPRTTISHEEIGRSQTGPMFQRGFALPDALEDETCRSGACEEMAVRCREIPPMSPARTAIFAAATPCDAPRQRLSVVTPAHRSGKTWSATILRAASAGKWRDLTGEAA